MKWNKIIVLITALLLALLNSCSKVTGDLDDQAPVLIVNIETVGAITIDATHPVYLVYYSNIDWTNPWLQHGSYTNTLMNPTVGTFSTYLMAFWDANNNGVVDAGEPCTGYNNIYHTGTPPPDLTKLDFLPLEWKLLTITLDTAHTYTP